jgi:ribosomal protein S18 acetylase RimI-like enzyme
MTIVVRFAAEADLDLLVQLNQIVQSVHHDLYPEDFEKLVDAQSLKSLLAPRLANVAIAELDGKPAGYIWFDIQTRPASPFSPARRRLYVHHLSVAPNARRRGIAGALMAHAEAFAEGEDIIEIALSHWAANTGAQEFFAAQGFAPYQVLLRKKLSDGSDD